LNSVERVSGRTMISEDSVELISIIIDSG